MTGDGSSERAQGHRLTSLANVCPLTGVGIIRCMGIQRWRAIGFGVGVHAARFGVIMVTLVVAPLVGISGWYVGLAANVACVIFAVALVTVKKLWRASGILVAWRGPRALLLLMPLVIEVLMWTVPAGLVERPPGYGLWALSLLMVGLNEELTSRVVVLERMRVAFGPRAAVSVTAALFGLQHLSALATTSRALDDVLLNVLVSACYGFALAGFQYRFRWLGPLVVLHAAADFTTILTGRPVPDPIIAVTLLVFIAIGLIALRMSSTSTDVNIGVACRHEHDDSPARDRRDGLLRTADSGHADAVASGRPVSLAESDRRPGTTSTAVDHRRFGRPGSMRV